MANERSGLRIPCGVRQWRLSQWMNHDMHKRLGRLNLPWRVEGRDVVDSAGQVVGTLEVSEDALPRIREAVERIAKLVTESLELMNDLAAAGQPMALTQLAEEVLVVFSEIRKFTVQ